MNLFENTATYNLSESKFSIGAFIFDLTSGEFVDLNDFDGLLFTETEIGTVLKQDKFTNDLLIFIVRPPLSVHCTQKLVEIHNNFH